MRLLRFPHVIVPEQPCLQSYLWLPDLKKKMLHLHENVGENKALSVRGHFGVHAPQSYHFRARCESVGYCAALGNHHHQGKTGYCYEFCNTVLGIREDFPPHALRPFGIFSSCQEKKVLILDAESIKTHQVQEG